MTACHYRNSHAGTIQRPDKERATGAKPRDRGLLSGLWIGNSKGIPRGRKLLPTSEVDSCVDRRAMLTCFCVPSCDEAYMASRPPPAIFRWPCFACRETCSGAFRFSTHHDHDDRWQTMSSGTGSRPTSRLSFCDAIFVALHLLRADFSRRGEKIGEVGKRGGGDSVQNGGDGDGFGDGRKKGRQLRRMPGGWCAAINELTTLKSSAIRRISST